MKAYRLVAWKTAGQFNDVPVPEPGPGEVLLRIGGAGACHSDLHFMHVWDESHPVMAGWSLPVTLGHENAGWVHALGPGVGGIEVGQPVVVSPVWGCGRCKLCVTGRENYCLHMQPSAGIGRDGGLAEFMLTPVASLVPLRSLEPWQAAPLTDAGLTSYHAVKQVLPLLTPDETAVVIGIGGLGHMALEELRLLCAARVVAVDRSAPALDLAREIGADHCLASDENTAAEILRLTDQHGAVATLDFVGIDASLALAVRVTRKAGRILVPGLGGGTLSFRYGPINDGVAIGFSLGGTKAELMELVALAEAGRIKPRVQRFPLEQVAQVYEKLERGEIQGRAVLVP